MDRVSPARPLLAAGAALCLGLTLAGGPPGIVSAAERSPAADVVIDPAALPRGPDTTLLHTRGHRIVDGDHVVRTDLSGRLSLVGRAVRGYVVTTSDPADGSATLWRVRRDGTARMLRDLGARAGILRVSPRGDRVAWAVTGNDRSRVMVARTTDGSLVGSVRRAGYLEVADVGRYRVLVSGLQPTRSFWLRPAAGTTERLSGEQLWEADIAADRAVFAVEDDAGPDGLCLSYRSLRDPSIRFWRSCTDKPLAFSPDRSLMVTTDIQSDGIGPSSLEVRDATHDTPLASYTPDGGYFGGPVWEDADSFVVRVWADGHAAVVRIAADGTVERVSRVATVQSDNFRALWWTFADR